MEAQSVRLVRVLANYAEMAGRGSQKVGKCASGHKFSFKNQQPQQLQTARNKSSVLGR